MSCNDAENSAKWTCKRCTYDNFLKSIKCTICLAPNPTGKLIIDETYPNEECASKSTDSTDAPANDTKSTKWNCTSCTYLNWPKSIKCIQCQTSRYQTDNQLLNEECTSISGKTISNISNSESIVQSNNPVEFTPDLIKINNNLNVISNCNVNNNPVDKESELEKNSLSSQQINNTNKPSTSSDKRETNYDHSSAHSLNDSLNSSLNSLNNENTNESKSIDHLQTNLNKWHCSACTYLNWPKSMKCILCQTPKALNSTSAINSTNSSPNESICCSGGKQQQSANSEENFKRNTPSPTIIGATPQRNRLNSNLNNVNKIITFNNLTSATNNRRKNREQYVDWSWLEACVGVLNADPEPVLIYLNNGGDLARQLTLVEVNFLNKQTLLGYTLVHLAIRFKRSEILEILLENRSPNRAKRVPCQVSVNYGHETRKLVSSSLKQRKGDFPCYFMNEFCIFALPNDILELSPSIQEYLFEDLLDKDVQNELEESSIINWSLGINVTLGSRLYALWNRSKGDCLLDSVLQATYGVFDKDNRLRKALADSLNDAAHTLFVRFKEAEILKVSHQLPYALDQVQWKNAMEDDWAVICSIASQPGSALEQYHVFVLSHILRRPIIVYGVKFFKSYRGEKLALAGFQGIYLPLHFDPKFCSKSPISLAYTKGHFTALVPMEGMSSCVMGCVCENDQVSSDCSNCVVSGDGDIVKSNLETDCCYLPLVNFERELLPLQFLVKNELERQEEIMRQYLDCCVTKEGILVCKQKLQTKKPFPVQMMLNEWLDFYRNIPVMSCNSKSTNEQSNNTITKSTNDTNLNPYISADEDSD